jgi:hypothetical protein
LARGSNTPFSDQVGNQQREGRVPASA